VALKYPALLLILITGLSLLLTTVAQEDPDFEFWPIFGLSFAVVSVGTVFAFLLITVVAFVILRTERHNFSRARTVTGHKGTLQRWGAVTAWFAKPKQGRWLQEQLQASRTCFERFFQASLPREQPLRIVCFERKSDFAAYVPKLGLKVGSLDGCYLLGRTKRIIVCAETACERPVDPERLLRTLFQNYLLDSYKGFLPAPWLNLGLARLLAGAEDPGASARLQRKMMAALARGDQLSAAELFQLKPRMLFQKAKTWRNFDDYVFFALLVNQSCSVVEYLAGRSAPDERRNPFRAFVNDLRRKDDYEQVFKRHFGYSFEQLLLDWQEWVRATDLGTHEPPPLRIRTALLEWVIPFLRDPDVDNDEKILAVRDLGSAGFLLGTETLLDLLRNEDDADLRREVVWALEAISGIAAGDDVGAWEVWLKSQPVEVEPAATRERLA